MIIHSPILSGSLAFAEGATLNSSLIPNASASIDLGSAAFPFKDIYVSSDTLKLGGLKLGGAGESLTIKKADNSPADIGAKSITIGGIGVSNSKKFSLNTNNKVTLLDENDDVDTLEVNEIILKDTSGAGKNTKLTNDGGKFTTQETADNGSVTSADAEGSLSGSFTGSIQDGEFNGEATFNNGMAVTGTTALAVTNVSGLASLDGGVDVDGAFTVANTSGNVATTGTLGVTGTSTLGVINASGLLSADAGIDVDGAFTVADSTGNVSTTGTLSAGNTDVDTLDASGLASLDGGIDVDGTFTVANTSGNVSTSGTLGVTGLSTLGAVTASGMDVAGHIIPALHNTYDLGSTSKYWRDLYLSSGSLYINGIQVLSTDGTDLTFRTDAGESVKILETGNDTITLESVNGDITLTATGTGNIELDAPIQINAGKNILSSDGNAINFADDISLGSNSIYAANLVGLVSSSAITYSGNNITVGGNTILTGDLTVNGTTTSVNSNTVNIGDNQIVLNSDETGTPSQNGGIAIERGTQDNASLIWNETNDYWMSGLLGAESRIVVGVGNTDITTLGTIATGTWNGTAINATYLDGQSGTNTGDETLSSINGLGITTLGTISTGVWNGTAINATYLDGQSGTNTGDETLSSINGLGITTVGTIDSGTWNGTVIASAYLDSDTAHLSGTQTFSGAKTFSSTVASTSKTTGAVIVTGGVGISGALNVGGDIVAYASSDERLKDNIELISNPIEKVQSLKGVTWDWNSNADELQQSLPNVGVIAQDVEKVLPQLVIDRDNGFKGVDYAKLTGLLIEAIKEQQTQIDELKSKLN